MAARLSVGGQVQTDKRRSLRIPCRQQFHVFEVSRALPRFAMYTVCSESPSSEAEGTVKFQLNDRPHRVAQWINQSFLLEEEISAREDLHMTFLSLRDSKLVTFDMDFSGEVRPDICSSPGVRNRSKQSQLSGLSGVHRAHVRVPMLDVHSGRRLRCEDKVR